MEYEFTQSRGLPFGTVADLDELKSFGKTEAEARALLDEYASWQRRQLVRPECEKRIFGVVSRNAQRNISIAVGVISAKTASTRTDQEKAVLAGAAAGLEWVGQMRARFAEVVDDTNIDPSLDESWPAPPDLLVQIADQF